MIPPTLNSSNYHFQFPHWIFRAQFKQPLSEIPLRFRHCSLFRAFSSHRTVAQIQKRHGHFNTYFWWAFTSLQRAQPDIAYHGEPEACLYFVCCCCSPSLWPQDVSDAMPLHHAIVNDCDWLSPIHPDMSCNNFDQCTCLHCSFASEAIFAIYFVFFNFTSIRMGDQLQVRTGWYVWFHVAQVWYYVRLLWTSYPFDLFVRQTNIFSLSNSLVWLMFKFVVHDGFTAPRLHGRFRHCLVTRCDVQPSACWNKRTWRQQEPTHKYATSWESCSSANQ